MEDARRGLHSVTRKEHEKNENCEVISVKWLGDEFKYIDLSAEGITAYGSPVVLYDVSTTWNVDFYSFQVKSLASSYTALKSVRKGVTASLVHSVNLAKHLGVEKLRVIRHYYEQYQITK